MKRLGCILSLTLSVVLMGAACGSKDNGGAVGGKTTANAKLTFDAGTTMARLQQAGKITVGVKFDQPGFGLKNPTTGDVEGFDIEIAKLIAQAIFGGTADEAKTKISFVESVSKNREPFLQAGTVDLVAATYTINDTRKKVVDFAGPYFVARQDIMVKKDNAAIKSVADLNAKKVCTVKGSTSEKNVRAKAPQADVQLFDTYSLCAEALTDGRVEAVTTDNTILAGLVKQSNDAFKLVENPFSDEPYGVGLKRGDDAFREFLNKTLEKVAANGEWKKAFERTLGAQGLGLNTPEPPRVDRYVSDSSGASTSTTTTTAYSATTIK